MFVEFKLRNVFISVFYHRNVIVFYVTYFIYVTCFAINIIGKDDGYRIFGRNDSKGLVDKYL